jgi:hypothetical protein
MRPISTNFEDNVFRSKQQFSGELLGEVVNFSKSPVENGKSGM